LCKLIAENFDMIVTKIKCVSHNEHGAIGLFESVADRGSSALELNTAEQARRLFYFELRDVPASVASTALDKKYHRRPACGSNAKAPRNKNSFVTFVVFCADLFRVLHNALQPSPPNAERRTPNSELGTAFAAVILLLTLTLPTANAQDTDIVARIGNTDIKADEIRSSIDSLDAKQQAALAKDPNLLNQLVRSILVQRVVLNEALSKHWDQDPTVVSELARLRENTIRETYLASVSQPPPGYPTDAELKAAYDANKAALLVPKQYRLAQIFIALPKTAEKADIDKVQSKLDSLKKDLHQKDADFAAIARTQSEDSQSASKGGEIGWLTENQIQPEIRSQVTSLAKGAVSDPIRLADGWHIVKVVDIKDPYTPSLDEIRPQLAERLRAERAKALSQDYVAKLLQQTPVSINELGLSKLLSKTAK
jgi:parvulin-like peptidyl-prolyl isomerase